MASFKEVVTDFIRAKIATGKVFFGTKATYKNYYTVVDFLPDDIPNWRAVQSVLGAFGVGFQVPFSSATGLSINWQTDIPPGFTDTYADIFGAMTPKPYVFILTGGASNEKAKLEFDMKTTDDGTNLLTVVLDWTTSETGYIQF